MTPNHSRALKGDDGAPAGEAPSFSEAVGAFTRIGLLSFGGPAGQIALMHRVLVEEKKWLGEKRFLNALNFCMLLPGPEAMQLATYTGWRLHGVRGGLMAGLLFVMPGALLMLALSLAYALFGQMPAMTALFLGIKAAVLAIVVDALLRIARRALSGPMDWVIAGMAFVAIFFLAVPFPMIVVAALLIGYFRSLGDAPELESQAETVAATAPQALAGTLGTIAVWLVIWIVPLAAVGAMAPQVYADIGVFFSKMAVVTFGGAYAVLAYVAQDAVSVYRWLAPGEMLDGLGLAETTPGPLILVNAFVGTLGAVRAAGEVSTATLIGAGALGWAVTLWATFVPCFLWIFAGAPYVDRLASEPRLKSALAAVTAAVVGVIANLTVWFALNVLFARVATLNAGPLRILAPDGASLSLPALVLSVLAFVMLFAFKRGVLTTLAVCGAAALAWTAVAG